LVVEVSPLVNLGQTEGLVIRKKPSAFQRTDAPVIKSSLSGWGRNGFWFYKPPGFTEKSTLSAGSGFHPGHLLGTLSQTGLGS
jgi:hypothetical protein